MTFPATCGNVLEMKENLLKNSVAGVESKRFRCYALKGHYTFYRWNDTGDLRSSERFAELVKIARAENLKKIV